MVQQTVADVMTPSPATVDVTDTLRTVARAMADHDAGALVVRAGTTAVGIVTDRDVVVRGLAAGLGPDSAVQDVVSGQVVPVLDSDTLVGIVSIGDLAIELDPTSALADISRAEPNQ